MRCHDSGGDVMRLERATPNGAYPGGLGGFAQLTTIESMTELGRNRIRQTFPSADQQWGTNQGAAFGGGGNQTVFGPEPVRFNSFGGYGKNPPGTSRPISEQMGSAQIVIDGLRKLADKAERVSRSGRERSWLAAHRHEFRGRWIALDGDKLLATGNSSKEVFSAVGNHKPTPLVMQIVEQESSFPGW